MGVGMKSLVWFAPIVSSFIVYLFSTHMQVEEKTKEQLLVGCGEGHNA